MDKIREMKEGRRQEGGRKERRKENTQSCIQKLCEKCSRREERKGI